MTSVAEQADKGRVDTTKTPSGAARRTSSWARRAPLLPALIFMIIVTQLPFWRRWSSRS
jgi:sorbitol/mannitol transport system permease protein